MRVIFAGTPEFAVPSLKALVKAGYTLCGVYTQPDRPAGRGRQLQASPVKEYALSEGLPVLQPLNFKASSEKKQLRELAAEVMVVAAYGLILPSSVLSIPRYGCLNIHASLLPRWRGAAPIQRAIQAGDPQTGISLMQMAPGLDTGAVWETYPCPIETQDTAHTLEAKLAELGAKAILEWLPKLNVGGTPIPQPDIGITYAHKLTKSEAALNWERPAVELERMIRAFNPWPVAFTQLEEKVLRIWSASVSSEKTEALPGTIIQILKEGVQVACGDNTVLCLTEAQWPGGTRQPVSQLLKAQNPLFRVGKKMEPLI